MANYYSIHKGEVIDAGITKISAITSTAAQIDAMVKAGIYTLPVATSDKLGGVMPIAKTSEMTQEVGVDSSGKLYTKNGMSEDEFNTLFNKKISYVVNSDDTIDITIN